MSRRLISDARRSTLSRILTVVLVADTLARLTIKAVAPTLVVTAPLLLAFMDTRITSQVLLIGRLEIGLFLVVAAVGMAVADPVAFALGRFDGPRLESTLRSWLPLSTGLLVLGGQ